MNSNKEMTLIVGRGLSGQAAGALLEHFGWIPKRDLFYFDDQKERSDFTSIEELLKKPWKRLIISPGYPLSSPWIMRLSQESVQLTSELDLGGQYLETEQTIALTGSVGKSTAAATLDYLLRKSSKRSFLGGNFGTPLCTYVLECLKGLRERADFLVIEVSSFQLENLKHLWDWGLFTPFYPNHLDRYDSLEAYYSVKWRLLDLVKKQVLASSHSGDLNAFCETHSHPKLKIIDADGFSSVLKFLLDNLGINVNDSEFLDFPGLPHRLEKLKTREQILFINDSKCTTLQGVRHALKELRVDRAIKSENIYLLLGGKDKSLDWENLLKDLNNETIKLCFFGALRSKLLKHFPHPFLHSDKLAHLLIELKPKLKKGDQVLLSPGGVSFDEFKDFNARGDYFKNFVKENFSCED
ncbi:MAG: hypothetical protein KA116_06135 [Proteobacteria bacterium]|nr:hypothetical protein [Pseudomonadota bacterium]